MQDLNFCKTVDVNVAFLVPTLMARCHCKADLTSGLPFEAITCSISFSGLDLIVNNQAVCVGQVLYRVQFVIVNLGLCSVYVLWCIGPGCPFDYSIVYYHIMAAPDWDVVTNSRP
jgi:hypothetical protein